MTPADIALGMRLKRAAGWTQVEADWRRTLELEPAGCFVAEWDGAGVGTVGCTLFGPVAWISLVLVDPNWRGRGIGRTLLLRAIEYCESKRATTVRLDATPLGRPLYASLGFCDDFELVRYRGMASVEPAAELLARRLEPSQLPEIARLDQAVTGTERTKLFEAMLLESMLLEAGAGEPRTAIGLRAHGALQGFCFSRPAEGAVQIGPCIATASAGPPLLTAALTNAGGEPVIVDIPGSNAAAARLVAAAGLSLERSFWRMTRGQTIVEDIQRLWASFGPEKG